MKGQGAKKNLWEQFMKQQLVKNSEFRKLPPSLEALIDTCSYIIYADFGKSYPGTIKGQKKPNKNLTTHEYRQAFKTLSREEKIEYYERHVSWVNLKIKEEQGKGKEVEEQMKGVLQEVRRKVSGIYFTDVYSRSFSIGIWKHKKMRIDRENGIIYAEKDEKIKTYLMKDYIVRKSKNKDYHSFVLEAINNHPHEKSRTVHLGFKQESKLAQCLQQLKAIFIKIQYQNIQSLFGAAEKTTKAMSFSYTFGDKAPSTPKNKRTNKVQDSDKERLNQTYQPEIKSDLFVSYPINQDSMLCKSMVVEDQRDDIVYHEEKNPADFAYASLETVTNEQVFLDEGKNSLDQNKKMMGEFEQMYSPRKGDCFDFRQNLKKEASFKKGKKSFVEEPESSKRYLSDEEEERENKGEYNGGKKTIIESIACLDNELIEEITERQNGKEEFWREEKFRDNIFFKLHPDYDLCSIDETANYGCVFSEKQFRICSHVEKPNKIKVFYDLPSDVSELEVLGTLIDEDLFKKCNSEVEEINLKTLIRSQNSAMMYMKLKPYNRLYRARDFVFLRHVFRDHNTHFMIDKSIENINYPPFTTIVRGSLTALWSVRKQENATQLIIDVEIQNEGYLNAVQNLNLTLKFLKCLSNLQNIVINNRERLKNFDVFSQNWIVKTPEYEEKLKREAELKKRNQQSRKNQKSTKSPSKKNHSREKEKKQKSQEKKQKQETVGPKVLNNEISEFPFKEVLGAINEEEEKGELDEKQIELYERERKISSEKIHRDLDQKGYVIISQGFIHKKHVITPMPKEEGNIKYLQRIDGDHPLWKKEWVRDKEEGSLIFVDEKKINDQKGVLTFIISQIGKNILSGKSVMNISLPVDIFLPASNLQIMASTFSYSSVFLEPAAMTSDPIEKLKNVAAFGLNNSPLYLRIEKPFNPILGETFQGWIDGCPVYGQQISHHPPIGAFYMVGRGYKISAQLESKIEVHMNRGCGINDGIFRVTFDDGTQCCYTTPSGQLCGLTFGVRKFNFIGKAYYWIKSEQLFLELSFNPTGKGFFSVGKQEKPLDYFEGTICKVKPQFFQNFERKKKGPTQKDIVKKYGKIHGIWNMFMNYDDEQIYDMDVDLPLLMEYEEDPLPSDSNWREDIEYRRIGQTSRAQSEKERLEILQRHDRKLRQKMKKK